MTDAKKGLLNFKENVKKMPDFLCIIVGNLSGAYVDKEAGIYVVSINTLKP